MKSLVFLIILMLQAAIISGQQIVLLYGSGSSGKSTLTLEVVNLNPNWRCIDEDAVFSEIWLKYVSNRCPNEYKLIAEVLPHENLFQAIKNSTIIFPEDSTSSQKESANNAIEAIQNSIAQNNPEDFRRTIVQCFEMSILDLIREGVNENKSILLDRWYTTPEMLHKAFPDILIQKALVFSTLQDTFDNFIQRNERAKRTRNASSHRLYKHFIPGYIRLYKLSEEPMNSFYCYQRSEIEKFFEDVRSALSIARTDSKKDILFNDITKEKLDELKAEFISEKFRSDTLFLTPIDQYDFIINSKKAALELL